MEKRLLFVDLETGGLSPSIHPLFEIGLRCEAGPDDPTPLEFSVAIKVTETAWLDVDERALAVNQFTFDELQKHGLPLSDAALRLGSWLMEHGIESSTVIWVGQNPDFDIRFLRANMAEVLDWVGLDLDTIEVVNVMDLARKLKKIDRGFQPTSLSGGGISLALGLVPENNVHRALGGVAACRQNYHALISKLRAVEAA